MAQTLFRGPVLQGKFNEAGLTGYNLTEKNAAYTLVKNTDCGVQFTSKSGSPTFTVPAHALGQVFTVINTGADTTNQVVLTGSAGEIHFKETNGATLTNTLATQKVGDFIQTHIEMMEFAKAQMDEITGVSRQRLGQVENRETVGGVERAVSQSNHITEELFTMHDYCKKRCFQMLIETAKIALKGQSIKFAYIADDQTRQLAEIEGDEFAEEEYGLMVSNDDEINHMQQKLDGMVQMGLQNQMLSFSTAIKIYNSPSIREIQRMIQKDETNMKAQQAKAGEDQNKQMQAQMEQQAQTEQQAQALDLEKFNRTDETNRYIAELQADTARINKENSDRGVDNDESDFAKFEAELGVKKDSLANDMIKHNDIMSRKDMEIGIKNKVANKNIVSKK